MHSALQLVGCWCGGGAAHYGHYGHCAAQVERRSGSFSPVRDPHTQIVNGLEQLVMLTRTTFAYRGSFS